MLIANSYSLKKAIFRISNIALHYQI